MPYCVRFYGIILTSHLSTFIRVYVDISVIRVVVFFSLFTRTYIVYIFIYRLLVYYLLFFFYCHTNHTFVVQSTTHALLSPCFFFYFIIISHYYVRNKYY